jgi:hypothetical protein
MLTDTQKFQLACEAHNEAHRGEMVDWDVLENKNGPRYTVRITMEVLMDESDLKEGET